MPNVKSIMIGINFFIILLIGNPALYRCAKPYTYVRHVPFPDISVYG
ncbi:hypothetical protein PRSM4_175 [Prochlorococcus phage P-RSM4]|uniref:Uncharacterized protein n=1 Tax=Prochlorococcus phage P-RSM4 TaxID=444862 RepID=E3SM61_9CAUD|nr:hypothetical protein PRSM4_175 [Prochlorococcus phage P-RSM4]ADO98559.1 hypothetical protein PRSM4_175 [Prochlorococcus phage P-RSM4]